MPLSTFAPLALAAAVGAAMGYAWEHRARLAEVATIRADIAAREAAAAEDARRRIDAAAAAADAAISERDARIATLDAATRRLRHDLKAATTGRVCLSADARGLLQQSPAFGLRLPQATGGAAPAAAAAAADPGESAESSDADVSGWILDAASLYEQCRARIDAIRQWNEVTHGR
jgi:outer membrane biosynthesis protein TonB